MEKKQKSKRAGDDSEWPNMDFDDLPQLEDLSNWDDINIDFDLPEFDLDFPEFEKVEHIKKIRCPKCNHEFDVDFSE